MISATQFRDVVAERGVSLPEGYVALLEGGETHVFRHPATADCNWRMLKLSSDPGGLFRPTEIGAQSIPAWELARGFAAILDEVGIQELNGPKRLPVDEFRRSFVFAVCDGDYLFFQADGSVWVYWHDGHEALMLAGTWMEWVKHSEGKKEEAQGRLSEPENALLGFWKPVSSNTEDPEMFELIVPTLEFDATGTVIVRYPDGTAKERRWSANQTLITFRVPEVVKEQYKLKGDELDLVLEDGTFHRHYVRCD